MKLKSFFPSLFWFKGLTKNDILDDLNAGLVVWILLVPQSMAYAYLAGMPPIYGLYAAFVPLLVYALMGTSRHVSIGPVAITSILVYDGISRIAEPFSNQYIELVLLTGFLVGLVQLMASIMRAGFLVNFLSNPVISGFSSAAAVIIVIGQLPQILGLEGIIDSSYLNTLEYSFLNISNTHLLTLLFSLGSIVIMLLLKKVRKIPEALVVVVLGILLAKFAHKYELGIEIIGTLPQGFPNVYLPTFSLETIRLVMPTVLTVSVIGIVETISIAKVWERKSNYYKIIPNQELLAIGVSKILGAFFQAMPSSASFSRSAVNSESGGKTQLSSIVSFVLVALTLVSLTSLFYYLPKAILAAIILMSVKGLFEFEEAKRLWKVHKGDFAMMMTTFFVTLILGIEEGILSGVLLSAGMMLYRNAKPGIVVLGRYPNSFFYRNIVRFKEVEQISGCLIIRFDNQLFFANALTFRDKIDQLVKDYVGDLKVVIIDASSIHDMDSTGMKALEEVHESLKRKDITLYISGLIGPVRDCLFQSGIMNSIGQENLFVYVNEAVENYLSDKDLDRGGLEGIASQNKYRI